MATRKLAKFTANLKYENLSEKTIEMSKKCILDWLGCAIRGSREKPIVIIRKFFMDVGGKPFATVFDGGKNKTSALHAAMINGAASHSLDFDDLHNASIIHLATVVIPPVFAIAEQEDKSGQDVLTAVVAGYEVGARVGESVIPESYFFWHTTATAGIFGAGAGAANILGLDENQTLNCLGSAGTQAAGLWEFLIDGAMSKTLHAGKGSMAGVLSAYLSKEGFTGAGKILEGEKGFCRAMLPEPHWEYLTKNLGTGNYKIDENSFKPYACCKHSHPSLYAAQILRTEYNLTPICIESIEVRTNQITNYLINNYEPQNPYGCKFSIQYCIAGMFKFGKMAIEEFLPEIIIDQEIRELMPKIKIIVDQEIEAEYQKNQAKMSAVMSVVCKDGRKLVQKVDYPKGDPPNPMTWAESREKFLSLATPVYGEKIANKFADFIEHLEVCTNFAEGITHCLEN